MKRVFREPVSQGTTYCHAFKSIPGAGVWLCLLRKGHRSPNHLDTYNNKAWPVSPNERERAR